MERRTNERRGGRTWLAALVLLISVTAPARGQGVPPPPDFHVTVPSAYGFDETVQRLEQAVEGENLMVVHEIDARRMLRLVGVRTGGMKQILFFHPRYMKRIIEANRNGAMEPPLKLVAMEMPDGRVMVRYVDPTYTFSRYTGLEDLGRELKAVVETVVSAIRQ